MMLDDFVEISDRVRIRHPERLPTQTLLGIRFWDPATNGPDLGGLAVTGQLLSVDGTRRVGRAVRAQRTRGGVYAFFGLFSTGERVAADETLWETVPSERRVVVDVQDPLGRYLPLAFQVVTPYRRPFRGEGSWLAHPLMLPVPVAGAGQGVYLWSAPARTIPAGLTAIYGQLVMGGGNNPAPAAYAVVEVSRPQNGGLTPHAYGITDAAGRLTLPLPYPRAPEPPHNDPYPPLGEQTFALTLRVYSQPGTLQPPPGSDVPDLAAILGQAQAHVALQYDPHHVPALIMVPHLEISLQFGVPFILRTAGPDGEPPEPFLRIQPV